MNLSSFSIALAAIVGGHPSSAFAFVGSRAPAAASRATTLTPLFGILDEINSDSFDLLGGSSDEGSSSNTKALHDAYEMFLGELVFSPNDPRMDIIENFERTTDPDFMAWLNNKVESTTDVEEKLALRDLYGMIADVKKKVELSQLAEERAAREAEEAEQARLAEAEATIEAGKSMSDADVLRRAAAVDRAGVDAEMADTALGREQTKQSFYDTELTPEIRMSYEDLLQQVLPPYKPGDTPNSIAFAYYDKFDAQFVKVLTERANNGDTDSQVLLDALAEEQAKKMTVATEALKSVLSLGDPMRMEGAMVKMAREGKIDEPFLLLLEANANQAEAAGAQGPAQLMRKLRDRANTEKDRQSSSKEVKLLRQLLRTDDSTEREQILEEAFTPKEALLVPGTTENAMKAFDGEAQEEQKPEPEVPPPDFINACKAVLLNFGNIASDEDRGDLATRIKQIASEAEVVATRIYGKGMTAREQQDRAWKEQTTSIFDLETMEIDAEQRGETAPWANPNNDDILPGFDADGKMKIGGG